MNAKKFDRRTVERYIGQGLGFQDFMEKYEFADETEFKNQLSRIYGKEEKTANRMINDLKKKDKKKNDTSKKAINTSAEGKRLGKIADDLLQSVSTYNSAPSVVKNVDTSIKTDALSYQPMKKSVPYATESESLVNLTKAIKNVIVDNPETVNVKGNDAVTEDVVDVITSADNNELESLKLKLAEFEKAIIELDNSISENIVSAESKIKSLKDALASVNELKKQLEAEKARVQSVIEATINIERDIKEKRERKKLLAEEIKTLKQRIKNLEVKSVYFGSDSEAEYDVFAEAVELESTAFTDKMNILLETEKFEDLSVKNLKTLAKVLCIIDCCVKKFEDKIEIYFDSKEYEAIFNDVKLMYPEYEMVLI